MRMAHSHPENHEVTLSDAVARLALVSLWYVLGGGRVVSDEYKGFPANLSLAAPKIWKTSTSR